MQQLQLTIDQDSQLLNELVSAVRSPPFPDRPARRDRPHPAHFDLPIEAPGLPSQLWSATELGKELGSARRPVAGWPTSTNSNARRSGVPPDQAVSSRKQVRMLLYNRAGRDEITRPDGTNHHGEQQQIRRKAKSRASSS